MFFTREPQALQHPTHRGHAHPDARLSGQAGASRFPRRIEIILHQPLEHGPGGCLQARLLPPSMQLWGQLATGAIALQERFHKRAADAEQRGSCLLRAELSSTGVHDLLAEVSGVGFHIFKLTFFSPYIQGKTALNQLAG
jgi:hypothetical protein